MAEEHSLDDLIGVALDELRVHDLTGGDGRVQVLLQVHCQELEDQVEPKENSFRKASGLKKIYNSEMKMPVNSYYI